VLDACFNKVVYFGRVSLIGMITCEKINVDKIENDDSDFESIRKLLHAIQNDPVINKKVKSILKMDAYPRRLVLNNWLEQLRRKNAPEKLTQTLSILFDDSIAKKIYELINKSQKNNLNI